MKNNLTISLNKGIFYRNHENVTFIFDIKGKRLYKTVNIGSKCFSIIAENKKMKLQKIVDIFYREYKVSYKVLYEDIYSFITVLHSNNLVNISGAHLVKIKRNSNFDLSHSIGSSENLRMYAARNYIPLKVHLELTYKCNLRCVHCYIGHKVRSFESGAEKQELTADELEQIFIQLSQLGCLFLVFTGGEIFTRKDIFEIMANATSKGFVVNLETNGTFINENIASKLGNLSINQIEISIYGSTACTHDRITKIKGSFDKVMNASKNLLRNNVPVILKYILMKENAKEVGRMRKMAKAMGINLLVSDGIILPRTNRDKSPEKHHVLDNDLSILYLTRQIPIPRRKEYCIAGFGRATITPSGDVKPCEFLDIYFGNLRKQSLSEIWFNSEKIKAYRRNSVEKLNLPLKCLACDYEKYCHRCPAMAYLEGLQLTNIAPQACRIAKIAADADISLRGEEKHG